MRGGRACITKRSPILPEPLGVNAAGIWDESHRSYPGRPDQKAGDGNQSRQPIQRCIAEWPGVSRGHSILREREKG
jgi:hypothetical protein